MFTKPQKPSGSSLLKNKDVKKLRKDLSICLGGSEPVEQALASLAGSKASLKKHTFQAPSRLVVYVDESSREPLAFDAIGKGDALVPSVYALWREPALLPRLNVHAPVSEFVLRGADVMLPGVVFTSADEVASLRKGELRAVYARGNPHAFAVGELLVDAADISKFGRRGRAIQVVHYYLDELWKMGPQLVPNKGFPTVGAGKLVIERVGGGAEEEEEEEGAVDIDGIHLEEELEEKAAVPSATQEEEDDDEEGGGGDGVTKEEMDALFYRSLLQVLRSKHVKEKQLPMLTNTFYAAHVLSCRPAGTSLNVKQSSYKKVSAFVHAMAAKGLLGVKDKDGVQSIISLGQRHPDVVAHQVHRTAEDEKREEELAASGGRASAPPPGSFAPDVQELLGLSQQLKRLLLDNRDLPVDVHEMVTATKHWAPVDVRDLVSKYIDAAQLVDTADKKYIRLNGPLTDALYTGKQAPAGGYPDRLARPDVYALLLDKCTKYHRVQLYPGHAAKVVAGALRKIEISAELSKKHKASTVTTVAFYHGFGIDGAAFAKEVQKKWGCSAALQASDDKARGEEIKVQGHLVNEVLAYLETKYKIATAKYCTVSYGKNVKPKKKQ